MDFKNVLLAIVLSTLVLVGWATFFEPPIVEHQTTENEITKSEDLVSPSIDEDAKEIKSEITRSDTINKTKRVKIENENNHYKLIRLQDQQEMTNFDTLAIKEFIARFKNINYDHIMTSLPKPLIDSMNHAKPLMVYTVVDVKGRIRTIRNYKKIQDDIIKKVETLQLNSSVLENLVQLHYEENKKTISFPLREYWLDIGRIDEFQKAQIEYFKVFDE